MRTRELDAMIHKLRARLLDAERLRSLMLKFDVEDSGGKPKESKHKGQYRKTCAWCKRGFLGRATALYCSAKCYAAHWRDARRKEEGRRLGEFRVTCRSCKKQFTAPAARTAYCSPKCTGAAVEKAKAQVKKDKGTVLVHGDPLRPVGPDAV